MTATGRPIRATARRRSRPTATASCSCRGGLLPAMTTCSMECRMTEVFVYNADTERLTCASCNPSGETPVAPTLPEYAKNLTEIWGSFLPVSDSLADYQPRVISEDGDRVFFDRSSRSCRRTKTVSWTCMSGRRGRRQLPRGAGLRIPALGRAEYRQLLSDRRERKWRRRVLRVPWTVGRSRPRG